MTDHDIREVEPNLEINQGQTAYVCSHPECDLRSMKKTDFMTYECPSPVYPAKEDSDELTDLDKI